MAVDDGRTLREAMGCRPINGPPRSQASTNAADPNLEDDDVEGDRRPLTMTAVAQTNLFTLGTAKTEAVAAVYRP
ncbi:unnamed protein product [Soboliphyme baturini]|uniref:Uncharacterized protein n=1 Tax=Soboliphyme baturini TaxID=241478 RepID=A0A183J2R5_9BILA|nr:unnamed protein product [Soboliphyme baturini]